MLCHLTTDHCNLAWYKVSFHLKYSATAHSKLDNTFCYFSRQVPNDKQNVCYALLNVIIPAQKVEHHKDRGQGN